MSFLRFDFVVKNSKALFTILRFAIIPNLDDPFDEKVALAGMTKKGSDFFAMRVLTFIFLVYTALTYSIGI